jgi:glutamine amidotransferase-like uncharacterized protein
MMMKNKIRLSLGLLGLITMLASPSLAHATAKPLALVWKGPGACFGCSEAAASIAKKAGFKIQYVKPDLKDFSVFENAKLWVQPGGVSVTAADAMGSALINRIREFVADGGGYVGFCAGAFLSTAQIGTSGVNGLGITPGESELYAENGPEHQMLQVSTPTGVRWFYYAGGPDFTISDSELQAADGQVIGRYMNGKIAAVEAHYGKGKVAVSGFHPEVNWFWEILHLKIDPDGNEFAYAIDMVKYATSP